MEGSIRLLAHTLTIGPHADVKAEISAKAVVIMGAVAGNVTAGEKVEIQATGSVTGDIVSPPSSCRWSSRFGSDEGLRVRSFRRRERTLGAGCSR
jgi:Polymer-forming cytoskeletal